MRPSLVSLALGVAQVVNGDLHQLIVGTFGTENLYTIEFDDVALTLDILQNYSAPAASSWITLSVSKPRHLTMFPLSHKSL
jgi:carboxy-cis,cis-muconate cyclase